MHFKAEIQDTTCNTETFAFSEFEPKFKSVAQTGGYFFNVLLIHSTVEVDSHLSTAEDTIFSLFI